MASQLPDKLKRADLHRFALRAAQLEKHRPIVTYWCEYYILQQILSKGLHNGDDACSNYAVQLMDKLEQTKSTNTTNDAIIDDVAAKAYIENFALETFNRADEAQRANKVTKQTADAFMAAVTFMDLLNIWGEPEKEIKDKSKFAKYHATRILKAFKAGEDPNATNPVVEEPSVPAPAPDELDEELKALETQQNGGQGGVYRSPTVEDVPDGGVPSRPQSAVRITPLQPPPPAPPHNDHQVSPIEPADPPVSTPGGGYFPVVPPTITSPNIDHTTQPPPQSPQSMNPQDFYNTNAQPPPTAPSAPTPDELGITPSARPDHPTPAQMTAQPPAVPPVQSPPSQTNTPTQRPVVFSPPPAPAPAPAVPAIPTFAPPPQQDVRMTGMTTFNTDDEAVADAMKHAKWAISALNFEDVNTAVKELRTALRSLGAG